MLCEICYNDDEKGKVVGSDDMREASAAGFDPFALGIVHEPDVEKAWWGAHVRDMTDDWELCSRCYAAVRQNLSHPPRPQHSAEHYRQLDRTEQTARSVGRAGRAIIIGVLVLAAGIPLVLRRDSRYIGFIVLIGGAFTVFAALRGREGV